MALLATPSKSAFCISEKNAGILNEKGNAVLDALKKIRKVETAGGNAVRLQQLDRKICALQAKGSGEKK
mgnify:FL=1